MELGIKSTPLAAQAVATGGSFVAYSSGVLTLDQALLLIIAVATTMDAVFDYFHQEVEG